MEYFTWLALNSDHPFKKDDTCLSKKHRHEEQFNYKLPKINNDIHIGNHNSNVFYESSSIQQQNINDDILY